MRISGGNDKQGFPMKQGVLTHGRVRLLLSKGHSCYRPRRTGERKRKSVRGCIVDANLSVLNLVIIRKGKCKLPLFAMASWFYVGTTADPFRLVGSPKGGTVSCQSNSGAAIG